MQMTSEKKRTPQRGESVAIGFRDGPILKQTEVDFEEMFCRDDGEPTAVLVSYVTTDEKLHDKRVNVLFNWRDIVSITWDAESNKSADSKSHRVGMASESDAATGTVKDEDKASTIARRFMDGFMTGVAKELSTEEGAEALNKLREYAKRVGQVGKGDGE
jgi:hypothetical protein